MAISKQQKADDLAELTEKVKAAKAIVMTGYSGTTVKDMDRFRKTLSKEGVFSKVYKVTLVRKAFAAVGIDAGPVNYKTPVILSMSDDEVAPARGVKTLTKEIKTMGILGGTLEGRGMSKAEVEALADLPTKEQLLGQLVGTINAPVSGFVQVLAGTVRSLINVLNATAQKGA